MTLRVWLDFERGGRWAEVSSPQHPAPPGAAAIAERLLDALHQPYQLDELREVALRVNASIGVAVAGAGGAGMPMFRGRQSDEAGEELLRNADMALYDAKAAGKNRYAVFAG
jgi:GGDEF domain-containing protein